MFKRNSLLTLAVLIALILMSGCSQSDGNSTSGDSKADQEVIVINGHTLPPEPDPVINNSTLLGVDSNDNGVRDDVEIYIYKRFSKEAEFPKTKTAIAMQYAWAMQKILENPVIESDKFLEDALGCQSYWLDTKTPGLNYLEYRKFASNHEVFNDTALNDVLLNTKERILQEFKFNEACSGNIFSGRKRSLQDCQVNIEALGE